MLFINIKKLEKYLIDKNVDISSWGKGNAKTLNHLYNEIIKRECELIEDNGSLYRKLSSLSIRVYYNNLKLIEDRQEFKDGRTRRRKMEASVAEKISINDKNLIESVKRALKEELNIDVFDSQIIPNGEKSDFRESMSYPTLNMDIHLYKFTIKLDINQYNSEGYVEDQEDKKTYFVWKHR